LANHLCARSRILFRHAHRAATVHSHLFEGWFDMRGLGAVLDHKEPLPIPHAIKCSSVAGSSAQRRQAGKTITASQRQPPY